VSSRTSSSAESFFPRTGPCETNILDRQERDLIQSALVETKGRIAGRSGAAARLGLPPSTLESKIRALKIDKHRYRSSLSHN